MKRFVISTILFMMLWWPMKTAAQRRLTEATLKKTPHAIGGIYDRPYIYRLGRTLAMGGYVDANSNYIREAGITDGLSFEARLFSLFLYSSISDKIKLTSALTFEHGAEEIDLETALLDVLFSVNFNMRAGILLPPIGRFNIAHDSPRYDLIERPLVATEIIPSTLSEVGFGIFGAFYPSPLDRMTYEAYLVNGLGEGIVGGTGTGTRLAAGKSPKAFAQDNNGSPAFTARLALNPRFGGEFGISLYTGKYNQDKIKGERVDEGRYVNMFALDADYTRDKVYARGELVFARIDVPADLQELFADEQRGLYVETGYAIWRGTWLDFPETSLTLVGRYDYIDLNVNERISTGENIGDSTHRFTVGLSVRPSPDTSLRVSYAHNWVYDQFRNLTRSINVQMGIATYF